jgi:hypothetical protein
MRKQLLMARISEASETEVQCREQNLRIWINPDMQIYSVTPWRTDRALGEADRTGRHFDEETGESQDHEQDDGAD